MSGFILFLPPHSKGYLMRIAGCTLLPLAAGLLFLFSCASQLKQKFLDEPYRSGELSVPLVVKDIEVADGRMSVTARDLKAPKFTFKQKGDTIAPPLCSEHEKVIRDEIRQYVKGDGRQAKVRATLKEGLKQYTLGFFNAREYAKTAVCIELFNDTTQPYLFSTTGEAYYEVKSPFTDTVYLETLYRKALKTSVYKAFESIRDYLAKQKAEN
jgi:predicted transcriptional regulator